MSRIFSGTTRAVAALVVAAVALSSTVTMTAATSANADSGTSGTTTAVSPFAVAPSSGSSYNPQYWAKQISSIGITSVRGIAQDNPYDYQQEQAAGLSASGIFMWSPSSQAYGFPVSDLGGWSDYIRQTMAAYPDVDHWEVWNEPPNFTADTDPAHYATIVQVAYATAKEVNPNVQIGLTAKATDIRWLGDAINAGAKGNFDYVTVHPYERAGMLATGGGEDSFMAIVPQIRAMLATTSPSQANVPIRFTEVGLQLSSQQHNVNAPSAGTYSNRTAADVLTKVYAMGIAQGVQQIAWFDPFDGDTDGATTASYGLIGRDGTKRPAFYAYARLIASIGAHPTYLGWVKRSDGGLVFAFRGGHGKTVLIAWSSDANGASLSFARASAVIDPVSGARRSVHRVRLTSSPVIVATTAGTGRRWTQLATARRHFAFNARTAAESAAFTRSVSLSATSTYGGVGILQNFALAQVAGRSAYKVSAPVTTFSVSPKFSAWKSTKIKVTAQVYGLRGNPGFNLKYDSAKPTSDLDWAGQHQAGIWQHVPVGRWTTLTWTIDDAAFVGMYGFTMRFDSDSTTYSGYAIRNITVTRA